MDSHRRIPKNCCAKYYDLTKTTNGRRFKSNFRTNSIHFFFRYTHIYKYMILLYIFRNEKFKKLKKKHNTISRLGGYVIVQVCSFLIFIRLESFGRHRCSRLPVNHVKKSMLTASHNLHNWRGTPSEPSIWYPKYVSAVVVWFGSRGALVTSAMVPYHTPMLMQFNMVGGHAEALRQAKFHVYIYMSERNMKRESKYN